MVKIVRSYHWGCAYHNAATYQVKTSLFELKEKKKMFRNLRRSVRGMLSGFMNVISFEYWIEYIALGVVAIGICGVLEDIRLSNDTGRRISNFATWILCFSVLRMITCSKSKHTEGYPKHLPNLGNSCYMATSMQILQASGILEKKHIEKSQILLLAKCFFRQTIEWAEFTTIAKGFLPNFSPRRQDDVFKYMESLYTYSSNNSFERYFFLHTKKTMTCSNCQMMQNIGENSYSILTVYPAENGPYVKMEDYVKSLFDPEALLSSSCVKCKSENTVSITEEVTASPEVLSIQISRWTETGDKKNSIPVDFEETMYFHYEKYRLFAVAIHAGPTAYGGHYKCVVKLGSYWFDVNDSKVSKIGTQLVVDSRYACGCFYKKDSQK